MADMLTINSRKVVNEAPAKSGRGNRNNAPIVVQSVGPILRERREAMGVTLAEAEVATRIRQKYLAALESDEWDLLPGEVVGRGFLRNYATYLGLEPTEMIERRRAVADDSLSAVLANTSAGTALPPERKVDYRPKDVALKDEIEELEQQRRPNLAPMFAILVVAMLALLSWWGITQFGGRAGEWMAGLQEQAAGMLAGAPTPAASIATGVEALPPNLVAAQSSSTEGANPATSSATEVSKAPEAAPLIATVAPTPVPPTEAPVAAPIVTEPPQPAPTTTPEEVSLFELIAAPTPQPAAVPAPTGPIANTAANLRSGPGLDYPVVTGTTQDQALNLVGQSADGAWYQLASGEWIFSQLVTNPPVGLPVVAAPPLPAPAEQPAAEQPAAPATP